MKRTLGIALAAALAISAISAPAMAGNGKAYGKNIKETTGLSYGQLKNAVWAGEAVGHPTGGPPALGAKKTWEHIVEASS